MRGVELRARLPGRRVSVPVRSCVDLRRALRGHAQRSRPLRRLCDHLRRGFVVSGRRVRVPGAAGLLFVRWLRRHGGRPRALRRLWSRMPGGRCRGGELHRGHVSLAVRRGNPPLWNGVRSRHLPRDVRVVVHTLPDVAPQHRGVLHGTVHARLRARLPCLPRSMRGGRVPPGLRAFVCGVRPAGPRVRRVRSRRVPDHLRGWLPRVWWGLRQ